MLGEYSEYLNTLLIIGFVCYFEYRLKKEIKKEIKDEMIQMIKAARDDL